MALGELFPSLQPLTLQLMSRIACTLGIAFVTGLTYLLSLMYSVQDYSSLASTQTGLPLAEIFRQATQTRGGAFALTFMLWVALGPCMLGSQLSMLMLPPPPPQPILLCSQSNISRSRYRSSFLGFRSRRRPPFFENVSSFPTLVISYYETHLTCSLAGQKSTPTSKPHLTPSYAWALSLPCWAVSISVLAPPSTP